MPESAYEPFVILERGEAPPAQVPAVRRRTTRRGRRAILLVDRPDGLDHPLAAEGFEVYRTASPDSALDLLGAHPSIVMALVRLDLPGLDAAGLIRELREARPGLWIAMLGEASDRERAAAGFEAGAADWVPRSSDAQETVARIVRRIPWAVREREKAERGVRRRRLRPAWLGTSAMLAIGLLFGIGLAALTRSWQQSADPWTARIDRILAALEGNRADRDMDRWSRVEQLRLLRERETFLRGHQVDQLEQQRVSDLLRRLPPPQYPAR